MPKGSTRPQKLPCTNPALTSRSRNWAWKSLLVSLVVLPMGWYLQESSLDFALDHFRPINEDSYWAGHREEVKHTFIASWSAYSKYAWGMSSPVDFVNVQQPMSTLSLSFREIFASNHGHREGQISPSVKDWLADEP